MFNHDPLKMAGTILKSTINYQRQFYESLNENFVPENRFRKESGNGDKKENVVKFAVEKKKKRDLNKR